MEPKAPFDSPKRCHLPLLEWCAREGHKSKVTAGCLWIPEILASLHDSSPAAHLGVKKTLKKARDRVYWVRQRHDVEQWCASCEKRASRKMERVAMDILGPLPKHSCSGKLLYEVEGGLPYEGYGSYNSSAPDCQWILLQVWSARHLHTDQGKNFESTLIENICSLLGVQRLVPHLTTCSPMVLSKDSTIHCWICSVWLPQRTNINGLSTLLFAYRSSVQETTDTTPFKLMFGREARLPIDLNWICQPRNCSVTTLQNNYKTTWLVHTAMSTRTCRVLTNVKNQIVTNKPAKACTMWMT